MLNIHYTMEHSKKQRKEETMNYATGNSAIQRAKEERIKANKLREQGGMRRYRLKQGERGKITFLDKPSVGAYEHSVKKSNGFYEPVWCSNNENNEGNCPHCAAGVPRSYVLVGTVINHNKYQSKDGKREYKNQRQYIVLKGKGQQAMLEYLDPESPEYMDVQYQLFTVTRPDEQTSCACGEIFHPKGKVSVTKIKALSPEDIDPDEFVSPLDYKAIVTVIDPTPMFESNSGIGSDDDPFGEDEEEEEEETGTTDEKERDDAESLF